MKKLVNYKNRFRQSAHNHKIPSYHILRDKNHNMSKGIRKIMQDLVPIYKELDSDFGAIDFLDLEFYERWLNGRY